jgi:membrane-associated phospholipid phosphatase
MPFFKIFHKIWGNIVNSLRYGYGLHYILAIVFTYIIVNTGLDAEWHVLSPADSLVWRLGFISVIAGFFVPLFLPLVLYAYGRVKKILSVELAGIATGQAAVLGLAISSVIKVFTGRIPPEYIGRFIGDGGFRFGFWRGGAFNGWPSSHTTVAFAVAMALTELYPENRGVKTGAWAFAILVGLGVSLNIHWLSDVVAGVFIGYAIGKTVGARFSKDFKKI